MSEVTLTAEHGRTTGTAASGRLRGEGSIPGVVYGHGIDPIAVSVARRELRAALHTEAGMNALINLQVDGGSHLTIVKELQRHPVRNEVTHVDFLVINRDEVLTVDVPILLEGEAREVAANDGTIDQQLFSLTVQAKPGSIPNEFTIDVSAMTIGDAIRVGDLKLPSGVETPVDPEEPIVTAQITRATIEAEELEAGAAEGAEAAEAAEGEVETSEQEGSVGETEETTEAAGD
jgi:large subunit ribosomal protein L25